MPTKLSTADLERFDACIKKGAGDACWHWTGATSNGLPVFRCVRAKRGVPGRQINVRWLQYERLVGRITGTRPYVLVECDNKLCVNPRHLKLDIKTHKRGPAGEARPEVSFAAVEPSVLIALDGVTSDDLPAIRREIRTCESRLASLRSIEWLALDSGRAVEQVQAPAPPKMIAAKPVPTKKLPTPAKKQPVSKQPPRTKLALRMVYFVASAGPRSIAELAAAMDVKPESIEFQTKSSWFVRTGNKVDVSDAGRAVALEGNP